MAVLSIHVYDKGSNVARGEYEIHPDVLPGQAMILDMTSTATWDVPKAPPNSPRSPRHQVMRAVEFLLRRELSSAFTAAAGGVELRVQVVLPL